MIDSRIGKFSISADLVNKEPEAIRAVLRDVIVLRCESMWHRQAFDYIGIHPAFESLAPGDDAHEYDAIVTAARSDAGVSYTTEWRRVRPGSFGSTLKTVMEAVA